MNQSENNFKITLRRRELKSTVPFLLRSTQLYTRHSQVERSGMNLKLKLMMLMSVCSHSQIMGCSPAGSSVHGILQARLLEWVTMPSSRGSSQPRVQTRVSCIAADSLPSQPPGKLQNYLRLSSICRGLSLCLLRIYDQGERCILLTASRCSPVGLNPPPCAGTRDLRSWFVLLARPLLWETSTNVLVVQNLSLHFNN